VTSAEPRPPQPPPTDDADGTADGPHAAGDRVVADLGPDDPGAVLDRSAVDEGDGELPPEGVIDAAVEALGEAHPELPLPHHAVEPPHVLGPVQRFDDAVDRAFDRLRGTEPADRVLYALTELGDFGLIWVLLGFTRGLRSEEDARAAWRLAAALGLESLLLNGVIKSQFKRERPVAQEPRPHKLRIPMTTSFPSGHSSTAMVASLLLTQRSSRPAKVACFSLAGAIAASRVHVRIHHASDVVGGVAVGTVLGLVARKVWPLHRPSR
jgi:undecaprenyl-diphosphatase